MAHAVYRCATDAKCMKWLQWFHRGYFPGFHRDIAKAYVTAKLAHEMKDDYMDFGKTNHRVEKPKQPRKADRTLVQGAPDGKPLREAMDGELDRWKKRLLARLAITP